MTVLIAHADADREAAEALEKYLERRGAFAERETAERGFRAPQGADLIVTLWSKETICAPARLAYEDRTLEGWAENRLALVKLDLAFPPVGLRDLPAIDACIAGQRDIAWAVIAKRALDKPAPNAASASRAAGRTPVASLATAAVCAVPAAALGLMAGGLAPTPFPAAPEALWGGAVGAGLCALGAGAFAAGRAQALRGAPVAKREPEGGVVIVCARADCAAFAPLVAGGARFAENPDSVRRADRVVAILSVRAFECDEVKRGLFLARRLGKPVVPILPDGPGAPADFLALIGEADAIDWSGAPESERARSLRRTLAA